jgi:hypothetical protein
MKGQYELDPHSVDPRLVGDGQVRFESHNIFGATGELLVASSELRFRSQAQLTDSLISSGFTVEHVYGDWQRGPVAGTSSSHGVCGAARPSWRASMPSQTIGGPL